MMLYCSRQFKNKLSFRSFALSLYKIGSSDLLRLGNIKSGKTLFSRLDAALALHYLCIR